MGMGDSVTDDELSDLADLAARCRREIDRLQHLEALGPCPMPPFTPSCWCDPAWLDRWMRHRNMIPEAITQQQQILARLNTRLTQSRKP